MIDGKIAVWLPAIRAGSGADIYTERLAGALERHGMRVEISWFPLRYELMPFLLGSMAPPQGSDIVIANSWNAFAFKHHGLPLIAIEHHCVFDPAFRPYKSAAQDCYHRLLIRPYEMRSFHAANAVVAVSNFTARSLQKHAGLTKVNVIYNWVNTDVFYPPAVEGRREGPFRLLFVGNASRRKGADFLPEIMRKLDVGFELRYTSGLKAENMEGDQPNMIPLGKLSDAQLIQAYQECDALLLPSRFEGFGYAALEAMACGKPVIASDNTALPEVVENGVTGILCNTDDAEAFANACRALANDPERCVLMGRAGRRRVIERFSEAEALRLYLGLIDKTLAQYGINTRAG